MERNVNNMKIKPLFLGIFLTIPFSANAAVFTGNELIALETENSYAYDTYIYGVRDGLILGYKTSEYPFCQPKGITNRQIINIVKKYFRDNSTETHYYAPVLIHAALYKAFPCQ